MPGFLYFLPHGRSGNVEQCLDRYGLSYLVDDGHRLISRDSSGYEGTPGVVLGSSANFVEEQVKMSPDIQWKKFPKAWSELHPSLGVLPGSLPGVDDLVRSKLLPGKALKLEDGGTWLVPNARVITEEGATCNLPLCYGLDHETGDWISNQVLPKYRAIWDHANNYLTAKLEAASKNQNSFEIPDFQELVSDAMKVNYRVSSFELATLGALVTGIAGQIAEILVDADGFSALKKKEEAATGHG